MDIKSTWINPWTVTAFEGYSLSYASRKIEIPLRKNSYNQASKFCGNNHFGSGEIFWISFLIFRFYIYIYILFFFAVTFFLWFKIKKKIQSLLMCLVCFFTLLLTTLFTLWAIRVFEVLLTNKCRLLTTQLKPNPHESFWIK